MYNLGGEPKQDIAGTFLDNHGSTSTILKHPLHVWGVFGDNGIVTVSAHVHLAALKKRKIATRLSVMHC